MYLCARVCVCVQKKFCLGCRIELASQLSSLYIPCSRIYPFIYGPMERNTPLCSDLVLQDHPPNKYNYRGVCLMPHPVR